jgi:GT2 family glycosyltransferase
MGLEHEMTQVTIGIHVHAEPAQFNATLASLEAHAGRSVELLILPDGPDESIRKELAKCPDLSISATEEPRGTPACFNRLAAADKSEVIVLLESGVIVGPGWLDYLLDSLARDPRNGLAGPSTNRAWNEQCVFPRAAGTPQAVNRTARECSQRFGTTWRTLEPLHSLADFCYVVKREAIKAIGAADEGYGQGPCWEMDYNVRAARAGFNNVWARAAYVYRSPVTVRQKREEALHFEANKRRYQDKFCALKLRNERSGYTPHCRGDDCEHFAPHSLIQIYLPVSQPKITAKPKVARPLVSCVMPTRGRREFVSQSVLYFNRQDYPERELLILDDGGGDLSRELPDDPRIRYFRLRPGMSIGTKRNHGCQMARGSVIACWDDDDWYAPERLSVQMKPLLSGEAEMCALPVRVFFDLEKWEFWTCSPELHRRLWIGDVAAGTLVYRRHVWERLAQYPDQSLAEDGFFLREALRRGATLSRIGRERLFIYLRHGKNSWSFTCGQHGNSQEWKRIPEPKLPPDDRAFYVKIASQTDRT